MPCRLPVLGPSHSHLWKTRWRGFLGARPASQGYQGTLSRMTPLLWVWAWGAGAAPRSVALDFRAEQRQGGLGQASQPPEADWVRAPTGAAAWLGSKVKQGGKALWHAHGAQYGRRHRDAVAAAGWLSGPLPSWTSCSERSVGHQKGTFQVKGCSGHTLALEPQSPHLWHGAWLTCLTLLEAPVRWRLPELALALRKMGVYC